MTEAAERAYYLRMTKTPVQLCNALHKHYGSDEATAKATGFAQSTINRMRNGLTSPNIKTYAKLARHLDKIQPAA